MAWDILVRRAARQDRCLAHVQARWTSLATIDDVWLQCGAGVRQVDEGGESRREMNAFSRPMEVAFTWSDDTQRPEVIVTWTDGGEACRATIPLTESRGSLPRGLRRLLHTRTQVVVEPGDRLADLG
jgi:hypothetical protein